MSCEHLELKKCTCKNETCERHGKCCVCLAAHLEKGNFPSCFYSSKAIQEKSGQEIEEMIKARNKPAESAT